MNYMRNSMEIAKKEIFYQLKSKCLVIFFLIIITIVSLHLYGLCTNVINNYHRYLQTEQMYKDNGIDIIEALKETNYTVVDGNSSVSSNPLKEDFVTLAISIQNLNHHNIISNTLEYFIFVFGTLMFGIYSAYVATYDYKYKTHKFFSIKYKQYEILTGKFLSIFLVLLGSLFLIGAISYFTSPLLKYFVKKSVPIEKYIIPGLSYDCSLTLQILFTIALLGFYIIISYSIGFLLKSMFPITIFLLLYTLLIPVLGKYDIKNICSFFAHKVFTFKARFVVFQPLKISPVYGIIVITLMVLFACIILFATSQRSAYN